MCVCVCVMGTVDYSESFVLLYGVSGWLFFLACHHVVDGVLWVFAKVVAKLVVRLF